MDYIGRMRRLIQACEQEDITKLERLLQEEEGAAVANGQTISVDSADDDGVTPLQAAAANGAEEAVKVLLVHGAALDKANSLGWTPLLHACRHGHIGVVQLLLASQADVNALTHWGVGSLTLAARGGHVSTVALLLANGAEGGAATSGSTPARDESDIAKLSPLHIAALQGHDSLLATLTNRGWDVNEQSPATQLTPLMCAAANGHADAARLLIKQGADANMEEANGKTALLIAAERKRVQVKDVLEPYTLKKLKEEPEDIKPDVIEATKKGDITRIMEILDQDRSVQDYALPQDGATPLMLASMAGRMDIVQLLVGSNCDMDKQDNISGWTALMQAIYHGKKHVAKYLIQRGADVAVPAKNGMTAFDMASFIEDIDTELYRLLASESVKAQASGGTKSGQGKDKGGEERKGGLKNWWERRSNRFQFTSIFKNMKNSRATSLSSVHLPPVNEERGGGLVSPGTSSKLFKQTSKHKNRKKARASDEAAANDNDTTYSLMDAKNRSVSLYTLSIPPHPSYGLHPSDTLKPVIPPFMPSPSFDFPDEYSGIPTPRAGLNMEMTPNHKHPMVGLKGRTSRDGAYSNGGSGGEGAAFGNNPSPNSSGGASSIVSYATHGMAGGASSATSSTLTPRSDAYGSSHWNSNGDHRTLPNFLTPSPGMRTFPMAKFGSSTTSPSSSHSGGSASYVQTSTMHAATATLSASSSSSSSSTRRKTPTHSAGGGTNTTGGEGSGGSTPVDVGRTFPAYSRGLDSNTFTTSGPGSLSANNLSRDAHPSSDSAITSNFLNNNKTSSSSHSAIPEDSGESDGEGSTGSRDGEVARVLRELELETYQSKFEEQEVDMETFLTLTDSDLIELSIDPSSRQQLLSVIGELQTPC